MVFAHCAPIQFNGSEIEKMTNNLKYIFLRSFLIFILIFGRKLVHICVANYSKVKIYYM